MTRRWQRALLTVSALLPLGVASAFAGPNGASVVSGGATVQGQGTANVVVNQSTQSAIINWQTFNIGSGETTKIFMPNSSSTQLDRVTGGQGPSQILGTLTSNGKVFLVNPDGILFGMGARINVGSLVATTNDIRNEDFVAGRYNFSIPGNPNASIVNMGTITAQTGGFAALVAPGVRNTGTIIAKLGTIALASGNAFTLDMYGDNLITLGVTDKVASEVIDVATGKPLKSLVDNEGTLKANGGTVVLTAVGARKIVDSVINTSGVIEADTIGTHDGKIVLGGPPETSKYARAHKPTVTVSGTLSAAGKRKGTTGGTIQITGQNIQVAGATINASGQAGGGTVLIGGDWGGGHPNTSLAAGNASASLQPYAVPNANTVSIDAATMIDASATGTGNGGKVIVWANQATTFLGTILANGGAQSGNGGFVETSGETLTYNGTVNTSAPNGKTGTWLLDPTDLTIDSTGASTISSGLANNNVVVYTDANGNTSGQGTTSSGAGDIIVASGISWSSGNTLTLDAYHDIKINNVAITNSGAGSLVLRADSTGTGAGTVTISGDLGRVNFSNSTGLVSVFYNPSDYTAPFNYASKVLTNRSIPNQLTAYMLVNTVNDLQNVENNLSGTYALGTSIDASATANWNGGAGFVPLAMNSEFTGTFNGNGHTITNLTISLPSSTNVGLFSNVGSSGLIENIGIVGGSVSGSTDVGGLIGFNNGTVTNVYSTGTVTGSEFVGGLIGINYGSGTVSSSFATGAVSGSFPVGGLIGANGGTVSQSYASGTVSGVNSVGGLVGQNDVPGGGLVSVITQSYATGSVNGASGSFQVGGLVGVNFGTVTQTYSTGMVSGTTNVGGLVGANGGGTVTSSYWDTQTTGQSTSAGGGTGLTTAQFSNKANFSGWTFSTTAGGSGWVIVDADGSLNNAGGASGATRPMLLSEWSTTISNPHQLQLVSLDLNANYTLANNLNLGPALSNPSDIWGPNGSAGFVPIEIKISNGFLDFAGTFNGNDHTISNLTINTPTQDFVGLFGAIAGTVENLGLVGGSVTGASDVGALAAANVGTVTNAYATATVSGSGSAVGGLVGINDIGGSVTQSYATGAVSGTGTSSFGIGGLIGINAATVTNSHATGTVSSTSANSSEIGGLIGANSDAVTNSYATGAVSGTGTNSMEVGGLIGGNSGSVSNSYATGAVTGISLIGGLVGSNGGGSSVTQSYAIGSVNGTGSVGGLIGYNSSSVTQSYATGTVNGGIGSISVGGLIGSNIGAVTNSDATGAVNGVTEVGGLVGLNSGSVTQSYATGNVTGNIGSSSAEIGGLIGWNIGGTATSVYATGAVSGNENIGGLIGANESTAVGQSNAIVTNANATGNVSGVVDVGGLIGVNGANLSGSLLTGTVTNSYATGAVTGGAGSVQVGGLIGNNNVGSTVTSSYATGAVSAGAGSKNVGGLIGLNNTGAAVSGSYATGAVNGGSNSEWVGGLIGSNSGGTVTNAYATGAVNGGSEVGGLVGNNNSGGTVTNDHATGTVSGTQNVGGLIGGNSATVSDVYATGAVSGATTVGGLIGGSGDGGGTVSQAYATGAVSGTTNVGGLIGVLGNLGTGTVTTSYATGAVSGATNVGGLIGLIGADGSVTQSYATGTVTAGADGIAGGLVGLNSGAISGPSWTTPPTACSAAYTCASGSVTVGLGGQGGGLVGDNNGSVSFAFATGNVSGGDVSFVGGLIGLNAGHTITQSFATGAVTVAGSGAAGGLIGSNSGGTITLSYATGPVNGGDFVVAGGLIGENFGGAISGSSAAGAVTVGQIGTAGGLVGTNGQLTFNTSMVAGSITNSYATGAVVTGDLGTAGGLVGANFASITQSYATGAVTVGASSMGGGLVGINLNCCDANGNPIPGATISNSYATGAVFSAGINVMLGGLVGENEPQSVITNSQAYGNVTSTASFPPNNYSDCSQSGTCLYVDVGGFVGANYGTISGTTWTTAPASCAASFACASGNVAVGSLGSGGGFVGYNEGIISYAFATGAVTGAAGLPDTVTSDGPFNNTTSIAGFVAENRGQISRSFATGDVGTAGTMWLSAGGFAGENKGTIDSSFATGAVMTGDNSTAGGFANGNGPDSNTQTCPFCFIGDGFNNSATISNSQAFGNVTVGASSVVGGFSAGGGGDKGQSGGSFTNVTASGSVNAGHDSVVGGLVGVLFEGGSIASSSAQNPLVASSGPNSIIGGIVGLNLGSISNTTSTAPVSGTSDSYIGGITGINLGLVTGSSTDPDITGTGGNNIIGGIAGLNAGSIDNSTALVALLSGSGSDTGGVAGVNGSYSNTTATIAGSSFPNGTITNSSATGTGFGSQTGTAAPASPPELPSWLTGCSGSSLCTILIGGSLQSGSGGSSTPPSGPTNTPLLPSEPIITPNSPPTLIPTDTLANQQVLQFTQPVNFTPTNVAPPLVDPATLASLNSSTPGNAGNALGGGGANGLNGNSTNGNTGTLANGRQGGNGAPPGVRLIDMPVMPLPPGSGVPPIGETRFLIDEVVLQFGPEVTPQQVASFARHLGLTIVSQYTIAALHRTVYTFRITRGQSVAEVIRQAEHAGLHVAAQPNYTYQFAQDQGGSAAADRGDPAQYIVQKLQLGTVHRITEGKDVIIAVIDSQIDIKQPDFAGRIVDSYDAGCGPNTPPDAHGTGMTGAIASYVGLLGVAPNARIIAICAFGGTGKPEATSAKIIRGVDYAIAHGAKIINMSFAGPRDPALAQELQIAREKGILIIAAAGNAGPKSPPLYPGADPNVMAVTATDEHDRLFNGANQGTYVAVAAPGVNVLVPAPNGDVQFTTGTSVASANVSGVAALLMAEKTRTPEEIRDILVSTAKHLGATGMNPQFGAGLIDPLKALRFVPPAIGRSSSATPPQMH